MAKIRLPYPHLGQQIIRQQAQRFNWLSAGRRWRKTTMAMSIAVEEALKGKRVIWGAPTYDQVRIGWNETKYAAGSVAKFTQTTMTAEFPVGNGVIIYRSLDDPDNARGHTADGVILDEVGDIKPPAWYEVLRPMLLDTGGWGWFIGTPKGRNWFWKEFQNVIDRDDSAAWQVPTLGATIKDSELIRDPHPLENPFIEFSEILQLWRTVPEATFRQEILAEFIENSGAVFRRIMDAATANAQEGAIEGHEYVMGVDWGKHNDFTVLMVIDSGTNETVYLDRFNQIDYQLQIGRLRALCDRFKPKNIIAERNSMGEPLIEQLSREGLPVQAFTTTNASKTEAIDALALAFERGDLRILPDAVLIGELQAYEMERLPSGMLRYSAPEGMHDDTVMALALAWHAISTPRWRKIEFLSV